MPATYNILIMGASYGSLLASKLLFGGHAVKLVCLPVEADLINARVTLERLQNLAPQGMATHQQVDDAQARVHGSEAQLATHGTPYAQDRQVELEPFSGALVA